MNNEERARYRAAIAGEIADWEPDASPDDPWWPLIQRTPEWFDALAGLASDQVLNDEQRCVTRRVMKYLISPLDLRPEFVYGAEGFREDLGLIALLVRRLTGDVGPEVLERHGLAPHDDYWEQVLARMEHDLDEDLRYHLQLLLAADAVAGDGDLAWAETADQLVAPPPAPAERGHTIVFAGPGTGKTFRIETELLRLLFDEQVPPEQILVTTFTNKAADELRVRVHSRLQTQDGVNPDAMMQRLTINTIHGVALQLVGRFHHHALFLKGTFSPMTPTQRMLFLFRHGMSLKVQPVFQDWKAERMATPGWAPADLFTFYSHVGEIYDFLSEDALSGTDRALRQRYLHLIRSGNARTPAERIIATYPAYWHRVQEEGFLDYAMLLAYTEALLDDPQVRDKVHRSWCYLLVDEYQDTNPIQDRIFRAIAGDTGRMFAVGDDDQSIYAFRGADVHNATEFAKRWPGATEEKLEENRRSTGALVRAASELIAHNMHRVPKHLTTRNAEGVQPWLLKASAKDLPTRLAQLLHRMHARGLFTGWGNVAVLFRGISKTVPKYMQALRAADIPAQLYGDHRFLKRPMVRAFLAILDLIEGETLHLSPRTRKHRSYFEALGVTDRDLMTQHLETWHARLHGGEYETLLNLFYSLLRDSGALMANDELLGELGHLSSFIAEAEAQLTSPDIVKRLSWFNRYAESASGAFEGPGAAADDAVQLMTIHKAKGLEFPAVVIADASEGSLPARFPENVRTRLRREMTGAKPDIDPLDEERRVLYVGMTRARDYLVLAADGQAPSPFIDEFMHEEAPADDPLPKVTADFYGRPVHWARPLHAHHSAIFNYHFCPRRYLLENHHGFAGRVIAPLRSGQSLHRALEIYHRLLIDGEHVTRDQRQRILERAWVRPRAKQKAAKEWDELFDVFNTYADGWEDKRGSRKLRTLEVERPFYVAQGDGVLTGRIDLIREREDRLEIVEFKYHRNPMMPDYPKLQLDHYSLAYPGERPGLIVHYLKEDREETVDNRPLEPIRHELDTVFHKIRRREFDAHPRRKACGLCPVRFACHASVTRAGE